MAVINVDKMSLKDLHDLDTAIGKAMAAARDRDRSEVKAKVEAIVASHGFAVTELFGSARGGRGKGSVSAAKYANPDNRSQTWTGRGRKPNWLVARLKKGAKVEDFAI